MFLDFFYALSSKEKQQPNALFSNHAQCKDNFLSLVELRILACFTPNHK